MLPADPIIVLNESATTLSAVAGYAATLAHKLNAQLLVQPYAPDSLLAPVEAGARAAVSQELTMQTLAMPNATLATPNLADVEQLPELLRRYHPQLLVLHRPADAAGATDALELAGQLLRRVPYPVLLVPTSPKAPVVPPRRLTMAVDGEPFAVGEAAAVVRQLVRATEGKLTVSYVVTATTTSLGNAALKLVRDANLVPYPFRAELLEWRSAAPGTGVLGAVDETQADLLIMVARRRSYLGTLFHKSVTAAVVEHCHVPVLLLPTVA